MAASLGLWVEALGLRASIPVLLRALPLDRVLQVLSLPPRDRLGAETQASTERLAELEALTDRITRNLPVTRTACLKRALLRYALLRREGALPGFVVGVRPAATTDGFEAHAWVCLGEAAVMEREPPDYRPTFVWPKPAQA